MVRSPQQRLFPGVAEEADLGQDGRHVGANQHDEGRLFHAAIAQARTWTGGDSVKLQLPPDSSSELTALTGKVGLLSVVLVDYLGFALGRKIEEEQEQQQ